MLNEQASSSLDQPVRRRSDYEDPATDPYADLREMVAQVMHITAERHQDDVHDDALMMTGGHDYLVTFEGELLKNSETAYDELDAQLRPRDSFALFRHNTDETGAPHHIHILQRRIVPVKGSPRLNLILLVLTMVSVLFAGTMRNVSHVLSEEPERAGELMYQTEFEGELVPVAPRIEQWWRGLPYALSIMLILGAHELGHYFAARYHGHAVSLPYFIPMPISALGTMGAVIRSREPMKNRRVLMDIGAAGPLAGMVFAIPILLIGIATSPIIPTQELDPGQYIQEGNSIIYFVAKFIVKGEVLPNANGDVFINQMAFAGWLGLLVTALNLIPVGQLDGGHVLYSLVGRRARVVFYPVVLTLFVLAAVSQTVVWLVWGVLLFILGRFYAPPLDNITPLDPRRRRLAIFTLVVFALVFTPVPLKPFTVEADDAEPLTPQQQVEFAPPPALFTVK